MFRGLQLQRGRVIGDVSTRYFKGIQNRAYHSDRRITSSDTFESRQRFIWLVIGANTTIFGLWQYAKSTYDVKLNRFMHENLG